jgi:hypothetical protein
MQPCCSGKAINITCAECLFLAFGIQQAVRLRRIVICGQPAGTIFFTLSHKRHDFLSMRCMVWFFLLLLFETFLILSTTERDYHHHLPPWIRSFDLFRHRRVAIVSWGVHDLLSLEVCSWGRVSGIWCCPFFQDGWSSFVCVWISRLVFQRPLVRFLWLERDVIKNVYWGPRHSEEDLSQCLFVHLNFFIYWTGMEPRSPWWEPGDKPSELWHGHRKLQIEH